VKIALWVAVGIVIAWLALAFLGEQATLGGLRLDCVAAGGTVVDVGGGKLRCL
jgi:hypothetical protein